MAGIVKFWAARDFEALQNPSMEFSRLSHAICSAKRAFGQVYGPRDGALRDKDRLESLTMPLHAVEREGISLLETLVV